MSNLTIPNPKSVWVIFNEITQIPRASKKEEKIRDFLIHFAKEHNLSVETDNIGNVLIHKVGTNGLNQKPCHILQTHMDMVCEKNSSSLHNFDIDPITTIINGDWVHADGTTLGADNGIGMAMALSVLASTDIEHPPLECLFTVDEEMGLNGAGNLSPDWLTGRTLLNLDTEDDTEFCVGCAGGMDTVAELPVAFEPVPDNFFSFEVKVSGLMGGHSGQDINGGRANAIKLLAEYLFILKNKTDIRIASISGGNLRNAIPREASAWCAVPCADKELIRIELNHFIHDTETMFSSVERDLRIDLSSYMELKQVIAKKSSDALIESLIKCPHGVAEMNAEIPSLVETSTNLAAISLKNNTIIIETSQRSAVEEKKFAIAEKVAQVFSSIGAKISKGKDYPGWTPNLQSPVLQKCKKIYAELFGEEPHVRIIHAGLECGVIAKKYPDMDMISFGPTIENPHSPGERVSISSVEKSWRFLLEVLRYGRD